MRFTTIDPLAEKHYSISPYAYCLNIPVKYIDPLGLDTAQRNQAIQRAQEYVDKKLPSNQYKMGAKGDPGERVDCSGLVSNCVRAGGEKDPNTGNNGSGVLNIESNTTKIDEADVVPGNIITFRYNKKGAYPYHVGIVKNIKRDENGNIVSVIYIHSSGGKGPNEKTIIVGNSGYLSINGFYKWDTKPDVVQSVNFSNTNPPSPNIDAFSKITGIQQAKSSFSLGKYLIHSSNAPIIQDIGRIIYRLGF